MAEQHGSDQANVQLQGDQPDKDGGQDIESDGKPARNNKKKGRVTKYSYAYRPTSHHKCLICSHKQLSPLDRISIFHKHFSSKFVRSCSGAATSTYFCPTCKCMHSTTLTGRLKICISSSTLHEFWAPRGSSVIYEGDINHIEYITIPGAQVLDLLEAWKIDYYKESRAMDIIVVAGLNNLIHGQSPESIMRDYDHLVQVVKHQGRKHNPETTNTCAIATLYLQKQDIKTLFLSNIFKSKELYI